MKSEGVSCTSHFYLVCHLYPIKYFDILKIHWQKLDPMPVSKLLCWEGLFSEGVIWSNALFCVGLPLSSVSNGSEKMEQEPSSVDVSLLDVYQLLEVFVVLLTEKAWRYIGLHVNPSTNKMEKDLLKAHDTIDCIIFLVDKMEPHIPDSEKARLRNMITDLQLNYAEQMK